ncbi:DUF2231 domain-containing protein [Methylobacillus caricis]|uniref:DUF2231 domain-containing protein n=1 Tax=Methylobacillus caricis TaxID=1971611 RepID=UPI001D0016D4|nr:DUF2231 domain-containing protein [Methylobacillus caricis]MCB5186465.1 DUF2231 domain-containing protein [Methylobacillus caricis]
MDPHYSTGSGTTAAIKRHPIHPMLVSLPIGFLIGALLSDIAYILIEDLFWAQASFWLLIAGLGSGVLAGAAGIWEFSGSKRARNLTIGWAHGIVNLVVLGLTAYNIILRLDDYTVIISQGLIVSGVTAVLLGISGWLGGELVFRHGIGVSENIGRQ